MKIYVASKIENAPVVKRLVAQLEAAGHSITYKWFDGGPAFKRDDTLAKNIERMGATAVLEIAGVLEADACVVLLPGGRGTHVELGAALASQALEATFDRGAAPVRVIVAGLYDQWCQELPSVPASTGVYGSTGVHGYPCCFHYTPGVERLSAETEGALFDRICAALVTPDGV